MSPREFAYDVVWQLQNAGFEALWAGGSVRDELLGLTPMDYDVATNARPEQVQKLFRKTIAVGAAFGVIDVIGPKWAEGYHNVQVATFRSDGTYSDGRRPDSVTFGNAEADAARRDFTINGLFFDPVANKHIDFVSGKADIHAKILRAIGDPQERFVEDKLRILRAVRMATRFDLEIEAETYSAAKAMVGEIHAVSVERIADELRKLFKHPRRSRGVRLLSEIGLISKILPEIDGNVTFDFVDRLPANSAFEVTMAGLLLPVGKQQAETIGKRLKLSNEEIRLITYLVDKNSSLDRAKELPRSQLFPLLAHPFTDELLQVHRARAIDISFSEAVLRENRHEQLDPPPLLTGDDLKALGYKPSPQFKVALDTIRAAQLDQHCKTKYDAENLAKELLKNS